ncbi:YjiH family protein [Endozoicomonas euniceicola]|uniref:YjiH family protein n=1 Tax=Endozoicomonas euniceicola TaxID=1234143 RepID=A0ABY6GYM2_9GAMM|nr:YjiH family protein [Endozoicomonas euniceicola]UYM17156.1 YjiH family protein [Endozoicomonas euniceicola]
MKQFAALSTTNKQPYGLTEWMAFVIPSLLGILLFITPVSVGEQFTIPVALLAAALKGAIGDSIAPLITLIIIFTGVMTLVTKALKPDFISNSSFLSGLFNVSPVWSLVRILGMAFAVLSLFKVGPVAIWSEATGGMVLFSLLPTLFSVFIFAGLLLPLLMNFGLLELLGALLTKVMRPVFGLPGRAAVDCIASWLGDGSVGILMTSKQYETKHYTQREAAVIGTTFSTVSITFSLVVIAQVGLEHMFGPFYLTVFLASVVAAIIVPKLPPLSNKKDLYITGELRKDDSDIIPDGQSPFSWGVSNAINKATEADNHPAKIFKDGLKNAIDMVFGVLPVVMAIGTVALVVSEYTPVFNYLGMPFIPLLELLQIPEAELASRTMMAGFADMFVPSILAASIETEMTRFVIAALSLTQLIYLSEVGALLLGSKVPVSLGELFTIFILRTLVTLPVIAVMAHLIF